MHRPRFLVLGCLVAALLPTAAPGSVSAATATQIVIGVKHHEDVLGVVADYGLTLEAIAGGVQLLTSVPPGADASALLERLDDDSRIRYAEPNNTLDSPVVANGARWAWGLRWAWTGQLDPAGAEAYGAQPQLDAMRSLSPGDGAGITVAVIDTGIDPTNWALVGRLVPGFDFVDGDADPTDVGVRNGVSAGDGSHGHGTYVAGLVATMAPGATIMPIRALRADGSGDQWTVSLAIQWAADHGADVINLSLGDDARMRQIYRNIGNIVADQDVVVVAAAGNLGTTQQIYPAAEDHVFAVAASDATGALAPFSGRGDWVDVMAPGTGLVSTLPGGDLVTWDGTSASTAVVAGLAARYRSANPIVAAEVVMLQLDALLPSPPLA